MGTSVSQSSPKTTAWRSVAACYQSDAIDIKRATTEIWRAAGSAESNISDQIKSEGVFACYELAQKTSSLQSLHSSLAQISALHGNSIVMEFAKRATVIAGQTDQPAKEWPSTFFKEVTRYLVARDASGFLGSGFRSKNVGDLIKLKGAINENVGKLVKAAKISTKTVSEWSKAADAMLDVLTKKQ